MNARLRPSQHVPELSSFSSSFCPASELLPLTVIDSAACRMSSSAASLLGITKFLERKIGDKFLRPKITVSPAHWRHAVNNGKKDVVRLIFPRRGCRDYYGRQTKQVYDK